MAWGAVVGFLVEVAAFIGITELWEYATEEESSEEDEKVQAGISSNIPDFIQMVRVMPVACGVAIKGGRIYQEDIISDVYGSIGFGILEEAEDEKQWSKGLFFIATSQWIKQTHGGSRLLQPKTLTAAQLAGFFLAVDESLDEDDLEKAAEEQVALFEKMINRSSKLRKMMEVISIVCQYLVDLNASDDSGNTTSLGGQYSRAVSGADGGVSGTGTRTFGRRQARPRAKPQGQSSGSKDADAPDNETAQVLVDVYRKASVDNIA